LRFHDTTIKARDGFELAATLFIPPDNPSNTWVTINSATATPRRFYQPFATYLAGRGWGVVTYDYRGIGDSKPNGLKGFSARARDWALLDMAGVLDWLAGEKTPARIFHVGHSYGGQTAGLLPNAGLISAMVTSSAQSGYWRLQGGNQKLAVALHVHLTMPLTARLLGYVPWSWFSKAEDLPKGVAQEWAKWCRDPKYLLGDPTLPLAGFADFAAPVLAYSFTDDDWGTAKAVDAMMKAYPKLDRRHVSPRDAGLESLGHFGFFRKNAAQLWHEAADWLEGAAPLSPPVP